MSYHIIKWQKLINCVITSQKVHNISLGILVHANNLSTLAEEVEVHEFQGKSQTDSETYFQKWKNNLIMRKLLSKKLWGLYKSAKDTDYSLLQWVPLFAMLSIDSIPHLEHFHFCYEVCS